MKYKTISCEGNNPVSKYYPGSPCMERIKVSDNIIRAVCWRCLARQVPAPTEKKQSIGFPRGWKFMSQFVHSDGRVFNKGIENTDLYGTLPPSEIKEIEKKAKPKKESLDDKISKKFYEKIKKNKKKQTKNRK